jgi:hypothetical protein
MVGYVVVLREDTQLPAEITKKPVAGIKFQLYLVGKIQYL